MLLIPYLNSDNNKPPANQKTKFCKTAGAADLISWSGKNAAPSGIQWEVTCTLRKDGLCGTKGPHRLIFRKPNQAVLDNVEGGFYIYCYHSLNWGKDRFRSRHFPGQNSLFFVSGVYTRRVFKRRQAVPDTTKRPEGNLSRSFAKLHHCLHVIYALAH